MQIDSMPRYLQIKEYLRQIIRSDDMNADDKLPSEKELCDQFSVSRITVRKAMTGLEEDGLVYRIPGRGTFVAARIQENDSQLHKNTNGRVVGVIMASLENPFQVSLLESLEQTASAMGFPIVFGISNGDKDTESRLIDQMVSNGVNGIILYPADGSIYSERVLRLTIEHFPVVLIDRYLPGIETCSVCFDNRNGGYQIGKYLIERGHSYIGVLTSPPDMTVSLMDRIEGFREAMLTKGVAQPQSYCLADLDTYGCCPARHEQYARIEKRITSFLNAHHELTALYCVRGNMAMCAYKAVRKLKRTMEIVSFDSVEGYEWTEDIHMVQLEQSEQQMGKKAVEQLRKLMNNEEAESIIIPCRIKK